MATEYAVAVFAYPHLLPPWENPDSVEQPVEPDAEFFANHFKD